MDRRAYLASTKLARSKHEYGTNGCTEQHFHVSGLKIFMMRGGLAQRKKENRRVHIQTWMTSTETPKKTKFAP